MWKNKKLSHVKLAFHMALMTLILVMQASWNVKLEIPSFFLTSMFYFYTNIYTISSCFFR